MPSLWWPSSAMQLFLINVKFITPNGPFQGHTFYSERIIFIMSWCLGDKSVVFCYIKQILVILMTGETTFHFRIDCFYMDKVV